MVNNTLSDPDSDSGREGHSVSQSARNEQSIRDIREAKQTILLMMPERGLVKGLNGCTLYHHRHHHPPRRVPFLRPIMNYSIPLEPMKHYYERGIPSY